MKATQKLNGINHRSYQRSLAPPRIINNIPGIFVGIKEIGMAKLVGLY